DHEPAEREAGERSDVGRAADRAAYGVGERAADDAAAPADVQDAREEDSERDEEEPGELGMLVPARAPRPLLLDPGRRLRTQTTGPLLPAGHVRRFRAASVSSSVPSTSRPGFSTCCEREPGRWSPVQAWRRHSSKASPARPAQARSLASTP